MSAEEPGATSGNAGAGRPRWTQLSELKRRLTKRWRNGMFLSGAAEFPYRVPLRGPSAAEMVDHFSAVQDWVTGLKEAEQRAGFELEWKTIRHRVLGRNELPAALRFTRLDDLAAFLGTSGQLRAYRSGSEVVASRRPELASWTAKYPFAVIEHHAALERLLAILEWRLQNPQPGIYLRQLSLPGVDTKFIEQHRGVLAQWLDEALPPEEIDTAYTGARGFERRYGFRARPSRVRFRLLDPALRTVWNGCAEIAIPLEEFARGCGFTCNSAGRGRSGDGEASDQPGRPGAGEATPAVRTVFVTENEINGLAFPEFPGALVIFGRGYDFGELGTVGWLHGVDLRYWGDIDTHGFAILNRFRSHFPHARSLLMDRETLLSHREHWGSEPSPASAELPHLTPEEAELYDDLRNNRLRTAVRLEQEFVAFRHLEQCLARLRHEQAIDGA